MPRAAALVYSTYLGGSGVDYGQRHRRGRVGQRLRHGLDRVDRLPHRQPVPGHCVNCGEYGDAFVAKLNPAGSALVYSTYLGGSGNDASGYGIAVDTSGNAYVTGWTGSTDFPTANPLQASCSNCGSPRRALWPS